jgi:hypothetical protein
MNTTSHIIQMTFRSAQSNVALLESSGFIYLKYCTVRTPIMVAVRCKVCHVSYRILRGLRNSLDVAGNNQPMTSVWTRPSFRTVWLAMDRSSCRSAPVCLRAQLVNVVLKHRTRGSFLTTVLIIVGRIYWQWREWWWPRKPWQATRYNRRGVTEYSVRHKQGNDHSKSSRMLG